MSPLFKPLYIWNAWAYYNETYLTPDKQLNSFLTHPILCDKTTLNNKIWRKNIICIGLWAIRTLS